MKNVAAAYDSIAKHWHNEHQSDDWWIGDTDIFLSMLRPSPLVLDIGCGTGTKAIYLALRGASVHGIDISQEMLAIARQVAQHEHFTQMDMRNVDVLPGHAYDGVFAQASLLHLPHDEITSTLHALRRRLVPNGILYVAVKAQQPGQPREEIVCESYESLEYQRFFSYYTEENLTEYLTEAGFHVFSSNISHKWIHMLAKGPSQTI